MYLKTVHLLRTLDSHGGAFLSLFNNGKAIYLLDESEAAYRRNIMHDLVMRGIIKNHKKTRLMSLYGFGYYFLKIPNALPKGRNV